MKAEKKSPIEVAISTPEKQKEWAAPQTIELSREDTAGKPFQTIESGIGGLS